MNIINIQVENKNARLVGTGLIVCGNSDYTIKFAFDSEWNEYETKTARFIWGNQHQDIVFAGAECKCPIITDTTVVLVGVYAGDLCTTTPASISCSRSILCNSGLPAEPPQNVYQQIIALCDEAVKTASSVRKDADNGVFNGDDYVLTDTDRRGIAKIVADQIRVIIYPRLVGEKSFDLSKPYWAYGASYDSINKVIAYDGAWKAVAFRYPYDEKVGISTVAIDFAQPTVADLEIKVKDVYGNTVGYKWLTAGNSACVFEISDETIAVNEIEIKSSVACNVVINDIYCKGIYNTEVA